MGTRRAEDDVGGPGTPRFDSGDPERHQPNRKLVDQRLARGWTQDQVARAIADLAAARGKTTGVTANTVSRLERGSCMWPYTLVAEFETLFECTAAELGFVNRRMGRGHHLAQLAAESVHGVPESRSATSQSETNDSLGSSSADAPNPDIYSPMLAAYGTPQLYILANNKEYRHAFPGITVGTNLLEWATLDPIAREVLVEWELETELLGNSLRQAAANPHNGEARAILGKCLDQSPDYRAIYDRGHTDVHRPYSYQVLRDPATGEITQVECNIWVAFTHGKPTHFYLGKPQNLTPQKNI
ncbi:MmyB family transcriptional regulator [Nocardia acidivorans]|uniref:MmyB family transcriptional regulator n=1 Tax=Nocardia acidivorans TaxID=404580 RepID=UPI0012F8436D|nr:hypothetical protein [Nocardia acidivorans]